MISTMAATLAVSLLASDEIARVDGTAVDREAFAQRASALRSRGVRAGTDEVLNSLVDEIVLADEARRAGLATEPSVAGRLAGQRRRVIADALVQSLARDAKPREEELRAAYHATRDFVRAQFLHFDSEEEGRRAVARLRGGTAVAEESKRARSAQGTARESEAQFTMRGQLEPDVAGVLFGAKPGTIVGPYRTADGWAVAKVLEIVVGDEASFAASRPALYGRAQARAVESARQHLVAQLLARRPIVIDEKFLASAKTLDASDADLGRVVAKVGDEPIGYGEVLSIVRTIAASGSAHASTPEAKRQVIQSVAEEHVLVAAATERGVASTPAVARQIGLVERGVLASAALERIARAAAAGDQRRAQQAIASRLKDLRSKAKISVDRAALSRAAGSLQ